jgi:hypothetical protein
MTTPAIDYKDTSRISPCALRWDALNSRTRCVNRSKAHRLLGHEARLLPLLSE